MPENWQAYYKQAMEENRRNYATIKKRRPDYLIGGFETFGILRREISPQVGLPPNDVAISFLS